METHHLHEIYHKQDLVIVLVSTSELYVDLLNSDLVNTFYGNIQPTWIVICEPHKIYAVNMQAEQTPIDEIYKVVPKLKAFLGEEE